MSTYKITTFPSRILRGKTKLVSDIGDRVREIIRKMVHTMKDNQGIGLAATQVGMDVSIAVVDAGEGLLRIINPIIVRTEGSHVMEEGCLSIPSTLVKVKRPEKITLEYADEWGKRKTQDFSGLTAKAIQHEIDHLNGKLIIDYLPFYRRLLTEKRLKSF